MKKLLIISPHFPPTNAPDMHRAITALPYLKGLGWEATVLCVDARDVAAPQDARLLQTIPPTIPVVRCRAWPLGISRLVGIRTLGWRARSALYESGRRILRLAQPDLVLFTTTQFSLLSLGPRWQREFQVPFVVDLQDPWLTDYYSRPGAPPPPGGWKYRVAHAIAARMEPRVYRASSGFVSVSPNYLADLGRRYPWFAAKPAATIPFGVETRDFAEAVAATPPAFERSGHTVNLVSVGAVGAIMAPAIEALFAQLAALRQDVPDITPSLRFFFFGTSYAPGGQAQLSVKPIADRHGVGDLVSESTQRLPWHIAQATLRAADGILIPSSNDPAYTPSKIAGSFLANRPSLVIAAPSSGAQRLNLELGLGRQLDPGGATPQALKEFLGDVTGRTTVWAASRRTAVFETHFTAAARTRELTTFLDAVAAANAARRK